MGYLLSINRINNWPVREYSVEELLEGIRQHNTDVLKFIYRSYYPQIQHLVVTNSGNDDDAQDIYQDALIVIYKKILKNKRTYFLE